MSISKQLLLTITLGLGMQFGASAYDAIALKSEITNILNFAEKIKQTKNSANKKVAKWLKKGLSNKYSEPRFSDGRIKGHTFSDDEVTAIARIIENKLITTNTKIIRLLETITKEETACAKYNNRMRKWEYTDAFASGVMCTALATMTVGLLYELINNAVVAHDDNLTTKILIKINEQKFNSSNKKSWFQS